MDTSGYGLAIRPPSIWHHVRMRPLAVAKHHVESENGVDLSRCRGTKTPLCNPSDLRKRHKVALLPRRELGPPGQSDSKITPAIKKLTTMVRDADDLGKSSAVLVEDASGGPGCPVEGTSDRI